MAICRVFEPGLEFLTPWLSSRQILPTTDTNTFRVGCTPSLVLSGVVTKAGFIVDDVALVPRPTILPAGTGMRGWLSTFTQAFLNALPEDSSVDGENVFQNSNRVNEKAIAVAFIRRGRGDNYSLESIPSS